jgi:hypothetical protein
VGVETSHELVPFDGVDVRMGIAVCLPPFGCCHNSATTDIETGPKLIKHRGGEPLCEDVGKLRCHWDMEDADLTDGNLLSNKMKINLHMTGALMLNRVGGEVHGVDIVAVDKCAWRQWVWSSWRS